MHRKPATYLAWPRITSFCVLCVLPVFLQAPAVHAAWEDTGPHTGKVSLEAYQEVRYVVPAGGLVTDGMGTREAPWRSLIGALAAVRDASEGKRYVILVAGGTFLESEIVMCEWVDLYGGFDPSNWERDIVRNESVLNAGDKGRVLIGANHARLDGFTLTGGRTNDFGAGVFLKEASPTLSNNRILLNKTVRPADFNSAHAIHQEGNGGGGICCLHSSPRILHNLIADNSTGVGNGAGILLLGNSEAVIEGNLIIGNETGTEDEDTRSSNGGAIACSHFASPLIQGNVICGNYGGGRGDAGGLYCEYSSCPRVVGNLFTRNTCDDDGAAVYTMQAAHPLFEGNLFTGNCQGRKGSSVIRISKCGAITLRRNRVVGNPASGVTCVNGSFDSASNLYAHNPNGFGGKESAFTSYNDTICDNTQGGISLESGALYLTNAIVEGNQIDQISMLSGWPFIYDCLIRGGLVNLPGRGDKLPINGDVSGVFRGQRNFDSSPGFIEDSFSGTASGFTYDPSSHCTILGLSKPVLKAKEWVDRPIQMGSNWGLVRENGEDSITLWGNFSTDLGTSQEIPIFAVKSYHLATGSPCIDRGKSLGAPAEDLDGEVRPIHHLSDQKVDVGADELSPGK
jgi:hypothetical protein